MPCCASGHQTLPNPLPWEVEYITRGSKYPTDIPLLIYVAYFPLKVLVIIFYLCVRPCHGLLYQLTACLQPEH